MPNVVFRDANTLVSNRKADKIQGDQGNTPGSPEQASSGQRLANDMFTDRRQATDRRRGNFTPALPPAGCRRISERRKQSRFTPKPWWLYVNYLDT